MAAITISNKDARRLWLDTTGLSRAPIGAVDLMAMIRTLGFVQLDTIRNVSRAHHHILWSRNQNYREDMLWSALADERALFEHFTHDASVLPMEYYPYWQRQFRRRGEKVNGHDWYKSGLNAADLASIRAKIRTNGPLSTHAFDSKIKGERHMWARPPHKKALDQMWSAGELTTSHRENFVKFYDFADRVIPSELRTREVGDTAQIDWLCQGALSRLGFGTVGDIKRFWAAMDAREVQAWTMRKKPRLREVLVQGKDGDWQAVLALDDIEARLEVCAKPLTRLRIINPFDPAIRDRARLMRLFGFHYRNEMFEPKAKRKWGYYVYPLLEGDRFVGRLELKGDRVKSEMRVTGFWPETGVIWGDVRKAKLHSELRRFARLASLETIKWDCAAALKAAELGQQ